LLARRARWHAEIQIEIVLLVQAGTTLNAIAQLYAQAERDPFERVLVKPATTSITHASMGWQTEYPVHYSSPAFTASV
jgi:hypothetical protein